MSETFDHQVAAIAALDEPNRRRLYDFVVRARVPVGRDEVSTALGLPRTTAAFHLDRLVDEGLLDVVHERLTGRTGPGAGRPAKLYLRTEREVEVSLPGRRYDLAGQLLAAALEESESTGAPAREVLAARAHQLGCELGARGDEAESSGPLRVLETYGFEPRTEDGAVLLGNCPFHSLAAQHTSLVCGMNLHLLEGVLEGLGDTGVVARLAPREGRCCVVLEPL